MMIMKCHLWQCTGSTDSIIWLADTMTFTGCICQTLHPMYADTPIVRIWQNREWILRRYSSTSWGIRIYRSQWMCTHISDSMMPRQRLSRRRRNRCRRRCLRGFNMEEGWRSGLSGAFFCGKEVKMTI